MIDFIIYSTTMISIWAVLGLSLNLQFGLTGLVNFGQVMPFAVGAYGAAFAATQGLPAWSGVVIGIVLAPLFGALVILPARRLTQDYWALITLGAGELFRLTMENVPVIAGGIEGASVHRLGDRTLAMILALALLLAVLLVAWRIAEGPLGRLLRVLREDETLAATLGRNPVRFQILVTIVSWTMAGAAGVLYAHVTGYVSPNSFMVIETFVIWTAVVLGGPGSNLGVILGTVLVELTNVSTRFIAQWTDLPSDLIANLRLASFGLVLVLVFLYRPQGLIPEARKLYRVDDR
ncbi:MAG TPA: branched-chain amino acid ABC transporter permease [Dongiaceae bacterium]